MNKFKKLATLHAVEPRNALAPKARVLVVDDDLDTVHSMAMLLKTFGHEVDFAINGFAALDVARRFRPDLILLDINLPDVNGDRLARQLKFEPGFEKARIIALSGCSDDATKAIALEAGCAEFCVKPLSPDTLERLLSK
jgi:DNA-binding response OmpR family regulator